MGRLDCLHRLLASFQDAALLLKHSGGVATLNHRLIAAMPPASYESLSMIRATKGFHNPRLTGAFLLEDFFASQRPHFLFIHRKQRRTQEGIFSGTDSL
jgi:hypothetical protein